MGDASQFVLGHVRRATGIARSLWADFVEITKEDPVTTDDSIAAACDRVEADVDGLVGRLVARIREVVPAYADVDYQDQYDYIRAEFLIMLDCLARGAALPDSLVDETRELGKRRAQQGVTLQDVVQSYHLALKAVWSALVEQGGEAGPALLDASSWLWDNVHVLTSAVADGHAEAARTAQAVRAGLRYRVLEALSRWHSATPPDLEGLVSRLGYDLAARFTAVVASAEGWSELDVESFQTVLQGNRRSAAGHIDVVHCSRVGNLVVLLTQGSSTEPAVDALRARAATAEVGVGMTRSGLMGAAASIQDARLAVRTAGAGEVAHFEVAWPSALLAAHPEQGAALLAGGFDVASDQAHLGEAVRAYAENGFSVSAASRVLHLHANSVSYRLDRWHQLTGWNPRTFDGLLRSVAALRVASQLREP